MIEIKLNIPDWLSWLMIGTSILYVFLLTPLHALQVYYQRKIIKLKENNNGN